MITHTDPAASRRSYFAGIGLFGLGVLVFSLVRAWHLPLEYTDEAGYLGSAFRGLSVTWAPLYGLWYQLLSCPLCPESTIEIYRLSHGLLLAATIILTWATILRESASIGAALLGATALAAWLPWTTELTQVNHFDLVALLALFGAVRKTRWDAEIRALALGTACVFLCYIRQDNLILAALFWVRAVALRLRGSPIPSRRAWMLATALMIAGGALIFSWNPFGNARGWLAFQDHYYWSQGGSPQDEPSFIRSSFGEAHSIVQALRNNPRAFLSYASGNWAAPPDATGTFDYSVVGWWLVAAVVTILGARKRTELSAPPRSDLWWLTLFLAVRTAVSISIFEPAFRYYGEYLIFFWIWIVSRARAWTSPYAGAPLAAALAAAFFISSPWTGSAWHAQFVPNQVAFTELVQKLRKLPLDRRQSWYAPPAYPLFLGTPKASWDFIFTARAASPEAKDQWLASLGKLSPDVVVLDRLSLDITHRVLGERGMDRLRAALLSPCYDAWDSSDFAQVYLRKAHCR